MPLFLYEPSIYTVLCKSALNNKIYSKHHTSVTTVRVPQNETPSSFCQFPCTTTRIYCRTNAHTGHTFAFVNGLKISTKAHIQNTLTYIHWAYTTHTRFCVSNSMTMNDLTNNSHHKQENYREKKKIYVIASLFRWKNRIRKGIHRWDIVRKIGFKMFKQFVCVYSFCLFKKNQFFFMYHHAQSNAVYLCSIYIHSFQ